MLLLAGGIVGRARAAAVTTFNYPNFSTPAGVAFFNSAVPVAGIAQITPAAPGRNGSVMHGAAVALRDGFDTEFQFRIQGPGGTLDDNGLPGGDGFALIIQGQGATATGPMVGYIPYSIPNAVALEFDTWRNGSLGDPDGNHLSVQDVGPTPNGLGEFHHTRSLGWAAAGLNLSNGAVHAARVQYRPGLMQVFLDGSATATLSVALDLSNLGGRSPLLADGSAWLSFVAGTGAAYESHEILSWSFQSVPGPQAITMAAIPDHTFGDAPFAVSAMASSGLPVTLTSLTPSVATVSGNIVTLVGPGTAILRASQAGDANWQPAANVERTFTVRSDSGVWAWGYGYGGRLGNGQTGDSTAPVSVWAPTAWNGRTVVNVAAGGAHSLALLDDGRVWAWGHGLYGQLGNGGTRDSSTPVAATIPAAWIGRKVVSVAAGSAHSLALLDDGTIWAWGYGGGGELGSGDDHSTGSTIPRAVSMPAPWVGHQAISISAGEHHNLAVLDDGTVWAWGSSREGALGKGEIGSSAVPVPVSAPGAWAGHKVVSVTAGQRHSLAILEDGTVWAWGDGLVGELGNGQTDSSTTPVLVTAPSAWSGHKVLQVAAQGTHSLALLDDGSVWAWGQGFVGQLGNGQTGDANVANVPIAVTAPAAWSGHRVVSVAAGMATSMAVLNDGSVWAWGSGRFGNLGHGQTTGSSVPVTVAAPAPWAGKKASAIAAGYFHALAIIVEPNEGPVAGDDTYSIAEDTTLTVAAPGVLGNDHDPESAALTATLATPPAHGALTIHTHGGFEYNPSPDYHGPDSFTYTVSDPAGNAATATVQLTVTPVNDPTVLVTDAAAVIVDEGSPATMTGTFSDAEGNDGILLTASVGTIVQDGEAGTWNWLHTPTEGPSSFQVIVTATDGANAPVTVSFTVDVLNVPPSFDLGSPVTVPLEANGRFAVDEVIFADPGEDTWSIHIDYGDGSPTELFPSQAGVRAFGLQHRYAVSGTYTVTVDISDGLNSATDTLQVMVAVNAVPVAGGDVANRPNNVRVVKLLKSTLLANDTDADGDPLSLTAVGHALPVGSTVSLAGGFVIYTAPANDAGHGSFDYTLSDGPGGHEVTGTVAITEVATVPSDPAPNTARIRTAPNGDILLTFVAVPGLSYRVQFATGAWPYAWQEFSPQAIYTPAANGVITHTDVNPPGPMRVYRLITHP